MSSDPKELKREAGAFPDSDPGTETNCKGPNAESKQLTALARSPVERLADEAQSLPKKASTKEGARPGDVARVQTPSGREETGRSKFEDNEFDPKLKEALDNVPESDRSPTHGKCAEINVINKALKAGEDVEGSLIQTAKVRNSGHPEHGAPHEPCSSCSAVLKTLGVKYVPR